MPVPYSTHIVLRRSRLHAVSVRLFFLRALSAPLLLSLSIVAVIVRGDSVTPSRCTISSSAATSRSPKHVVSSVVGSDHVGRYEILLYRDVPNCLDPYRMLRYPYRTLDTDPRQNSRYVSCIRYLTVRITPRVGMPNAKCAMPRGIRHYAFDAF